MKNLNDILKVYEQNAKILDDTTIELEFYCADEGSSLHAISARYDAHHNKIIVNVRKENEND